MSKPCESRLVQFLRPLALLLLLILPATLRAESPIQRPNIVVIVADDLGYNDVGFHGGKQIPTPNLDKLAAEGVQFTNGYVSCPVCSPTRAGLLTGRYQQRFGHEFNPGGNPAPAAAEIGLPTSETTIADALKAAGYTTALVGKWHLGNAEKFRPLERGFDEFYGFLGGAHAFVPRGQARRAARAPIYRNNEAVDMPPHLTHAFGKEATEVVSRQSEEPYFLLLTFNAVHTPLQPDAAHLAKFAHIENEKRRQYAGLLAGLDTAVGQVLDGIEESGEEENTLIFFISDNGGPQRANGSDNTPLRGDKGTVFEGGIRVPFVMKWSGKLPAGEKYDQPVISLDIAATAAAAASAELGTSERPIDGVDLMPYVLGKKEGAPHESLYWRFGPQRAIRHGDYKLVYQRNESPQLYNLADDVSESDDLAGEQPDLVEKLESAYADWNEELAEPLWKRMPPKRKQNQKPRQRQRRRQQQSAEAAAGQR
jgi:arylsulfatase A-like enzyme